MPGPRDRSIDIPALAAAVRADERPQVARAITLVESVARRHREPAQELLMELLPHSGGAQRIGITGVPGVGKSTFIESLGLQLIAKGHKVAVLAVDPSSSRTRGSILGDKTRMAGLSVEPDAYIRPSPTSGTLGGVARATREAIIVLEAAGFDVILVETVGVGQSEITVAGMTDIFTFLTLARTGDQLQGIKKGVLEIAELIAVNKADGEHVREAKRAARELGSALRMIQPHDALWTPPVMTMSGLSGDGVEEFWEKVQAHRETMERSGEFSRRRARQQAEWTWSMVREELLARLTERNSVQEVAGEAISEVEAGELTATLAARRILDAYDSSAE
ncbi:methylmalonyl Co-A mutase-associated GTPase MeaB [Dietzia sp.]|uniref:methylmalonyl Co-A mutase-associated GTPase MeaB n=1 Tax=Dietzia sp. TaxID=1871616 RepID=UPI002FDB2C8D